MKRYISAILIPCLLLQLCGCYSLKEITLDEFSGQENELVISTSDSSKYFLKKYFMNEEIVQNAGSYFSNQWLIKPGCITILNSISYTTSTEEVNPYVKKDTINVNFNSITQLMAEKHDTGKTILLAIGIIALLILIAELTIEEQKWEFPQVSYPTIY